MKTLQITHFMDADGVIPLVSVPLENADSAAILYQEDFEFLLVDRI
jgi:hypothetical protein